MRRGKNPHRWKSRRTEMADLRPRALRYHAGTPMSARPFAVGGRLAVPSAYIAAEPGRVGQALPLPGDRVAQGGKLQAQRLQFERRLRLCDPEVATVNSSLELTVGSSSKEKPTVTRAMTVATRPFVCAGPVLCRRFPTSQVDRTRARGRMSAPPVGALTILRQGGSPFGGLLEHLG